MSETGSLRADIMERVVGLREKGMTLDDIGKSTGLSSYQVLLVLQQAQIDKEAQGE